MKKIFFGAALVLAALNFASCKDNTPACWEITIKTSMEMMGEKVENTMTYFFYGTEADADAYVKTLEKSNVSMAGMEAKFDASKKKADKAEADCVGMDVKM